MVLVDKQINELIAAGVLKNADSAQTGSVSYDLRTAYFAQQENNLLDEITLEHGESVFVACVEEVSLPDTLMARVVLRNSRIRQGFTLDAPVYQPGHRTRLFFRLTNMAEKQIALTKEDSFAQVMFEQLETAPEKPYVGSYQDETLFRGIGEAYRHPFKLEMKDVEEKAESIRSMEKNIYANVITLMTVFIALFSLINVNIDLAYAETIAMKRMAVFNLATVGSIAFLVSLIKTTTGVKHREWFLLMAASLVLLGAAVVVALI